MDSLSPPAPPASQLVRVRGLRLTVPSAAGPVNILRGIDLDVGAGQAVAIVGPSGSGKTSLLMVLAGLERASAGSVVLDGQELVGLDEDALALMRRRMVGIVFQSFHLIPTMTALENVAVPLELAGAPDAMARAAESLRAVGLGHRLTHLPGQLSGGEQQRVALARAFAPSAAAAAGRRADRQPGPCATGECGDGRCCSACCGRHGTTLLLITHDPGLGGALRPRQVHDGRRP